MMRLNKSLHVALQTSEPVDLFLLALVDWPEEQVALLAPPPVLSPVDALGHLRRDVARAIQHGESPVEAFLKAGLLSETAHVLAEQALSERDLATVYGASVAICGVSKDNAVDFPVGLLSIKLARVWLDLFMETEDSTLLNLVTTLLLNSSFFETRTTSDYRTILDVLTSIIPSIGLTDAELLARTLHLAEENLSDESELGYRRALLNFSAYALYKLHPGSADAAILSVICARMRELLSIANLEIIAGGIHDGLATMLLELYRATDDEQTLRESITMRRAGLDLDQRERPDTFDRPETLPARYRALFESLEMLWVSTDDPTLLADMETTARMLVEMPDLEYGHTASFTLGVVRLLQHEHKPDLSAIAEAYRLLADSFADTPTTSPNRADYAKIFTRAVHAYYIQTHDIGVLVKHISTVEEVLNYLEAGSDRASKLTDLSYDLGELYQWNSDLRLLHRAILLLDEALELTDPEDRQLPSRLSSLGAHLAELYSQTKQPGLLDRALELSERAVATQGADSIGMEEHNLGHVFILKYLDTRNNAYLHKADMHLQAGFQRCPSSDYAQLILLQSSAALYGRMYDNSHQDEWLRRKQEALEEVLERTSTTDLLYADRAAKVALGLLEISDTLGGSRFERILGLTRQLVARLELLEGSISVFTGDGPALVRLLAAVAHSETVDITAQERILGWQVAAELGTALLDGIRFRGISADARATEQFEHRLAIRKNYDGLGPLTAWAYLQSSDPSDEGAAVAWALGAVESGLSVASAELAWELEIERAVERLPSDAPLRKRIGEIRRLLSDAGLSERRLPQPADFVMSSVVPLSDTDSPNRSSLLRELRTAIEDLSIFGQPDNAAFWLYRLCDLVLAEGLSIAWYTTVELAEGWQSPFPGLCLQLSETGPTAVTTQPWLNRSVVQHFSSRFSDVARRFDRSGPSAATERLRDGTSSEGYSEGAESFDAVASDFKRLFSLEPEEVLSEPWTIIGAGEVGLLPLAIVAPRAQFATSATWLFRRRRAVPTGWRERALIIADPDLSLPGAAREVVLLDSVISGTSLVGRVGAPLSRADVIPHLQDTQRSIIHIAAHGVDEPAILLNGPHPSGGGTWTPDLLSKHLVLDDFKALGATFENLWLFFINCCFLGTTRRGWRDDAIGFATIALAHGTSYAIAPLWAVSDFGAAAFAASFYRNLDDTDGDVRAAFRDAQQNSPDPAVAYAYILLG